MEKYTGNHDIDSFLAFLAAAPIQHEGLSEDEIRVIRNAYQDYEIPEDYIAFLRFGGRKYSPMTGEDFCLVSDNGKFIDFREWVKEEDDDDEQFREYGFSYDECLFFWTLQSNVYAFFRLTDAEPLYYRIISDCADKTPDEGRPFIDFLIASYNEHVYYCNLSECPWSDFDRRFNQQRMLIIKDTYGFDSDCKTVSVKAEHDVYTISCKTDPAKQMGILDPVIMASTLRSNSFFLYFGGELKCYIPLKNTDYKTPDGFDITSSHTFILEREDNWGVFSVNGKVIVFGSPFREKFAGIAGKLGLKRWIL